MLTRRQLGQLTLAALARRLLQHAAGITDQKRVQAMRAVVRTGIAQATEDDPDPRDAIGLLCAGCGRMLTRTDASYEHQQRHDPLYPDIGRWLAWTDAGWLCARCAHPPRARRARQYVPGLVDRWIVDVDGWKAETARGTLPGVELGDGVQ